MRLLVIAPVAAVVVAGLAYGLPASTIESAYAQGVYPFIAFLVGIASDAVPFSIAELLVFALVLTAIYVPIRVLRTKGKLRIGFGERLRRLLRLGLRTAVIGAGFGFVAFELLWGLNYHRVPIEERIGWNAKALERTAFVAKLESLAERASTARSVATWDDEVARAVVDGVDLVVERLEGAPVFCARRPKTLIFNAYFAKVGIHGITIPFTHEAHHRHDLFAWELPFVVAHERAHLAGYASEAEASFVAYHACLSSRNPLARYAGLLAAYRHFRGAATPDERRAADAKLSETVRGDLRAIATRDERERSGLHAMTQAINDSYLKANDVATGVKDYGRVVELILGVPLDERE